jgi:hypothetical protein
MVTRCSAASRGRSQTRRLAPPLTPHCATSDQALTSAAEPCDRWQGGSWITGAPMELDHFLTAGHTRSI